MSKPDAYPLAWPEGRKRTRIRARAKFVNTFDRARVALREEIRRLGGQYAILSTNIPLRQDGQPYANTRQPEDPGVAVYFTRKGKQMVFACDRWDRVVDNIIAIQKTIEALRGIERWGTGEMMEQAVNAFQALPPAAKGPRHWREVLNLPSQHASLTDVENQYRHLARVHHPDAGGNGDAMAELNHARDEARRALGAL